MDPTDAVRYVLDVPYKRSTNKIAAHTFADCPALRAKLRQYPRLSVRESRSDDPLETSECEFCKRRGAA